MIQLDVMCHLVTPKEAAACVMTSRQVVACVHRGRKLARASAARDAKADPTGHTVVSLSLNAVGVGDVPMLLCHQWMS